MNPCHVLHISFRSIPVLLYSKRQFLFYLHHSRLLDRILNGRLNSDQYVSQVSHILASLVLTLLISACTNYDPLSYVILSNFALNPQICSQIFPPATPKSVTPLLRRGSFTQNCTKSSVRYIFRHKVLGRVIHELWILL